MPGWITDGRSFWILIERQSARKSKTKNGRLLASRASNPLDTVPILELRGKWVNVIIIIMISIIIISSSSGQQLSGRYDATRRCCGLSVAACCDGTTACRRPIIVDLRQWLIDANRSLIRLNVANIATDPLSCSTPTLSLYLRACQFFVTRHLSRGHSRHVRHVFCRPWWSVSLSVRSTFAMTTNSFIDCTITYYWPA